MALLPLLYTAEIHLVMAQQSIVNVESQVGQSVVDSTTDVDVSKTTNSATSGGLPEGNRTETSTRDLGTAKVAREGTESGRDVISDPSVSLCFLQSEVCRSRTHNSPKRQKTTDESRTQTPGVGGDLVDSDIDVGSGSGSPTKSAGIEGSAKATTRTSVRKPPSFKAVSINKHFLEKASAGPGSTPTKAVFGSERCIAHYPFVAPSKAANMGQVTSLSPQTNSSSPAILSFAKPRLVAKSSSGIRDSSPGGLGSSASAGAKNAVEAQRAVWNKNQRMSHPMP